LQKYKQPLTFQNNVQTCTVLTSLYKTLS